MVRIAMRQDVTCLRGEADDTAFAVMVSSGGKVCSFENVGIAVGTGCVVSVGTALFPSPFELHMVERKEAKA